MFLSVLFSPQHLNYTIMADADRVVKRVDFKKTGKSEVSGTVALQNNQERCIDEVVYLKVIMLFLNCFTPTDRCASIQNNK